MNLLNLEYTRDFSLVYINNGIRKGGLGRADGSPGHHTSRGTNF